jgi:hypothetical protein
MTLTQQPAPPRPSMLSPVVTAAFGFVVYALSAIGGAVFDVNMDSRLQPERLHTIWQSATDMAPEFAIGLIGVAIAVWTGRRAWLAQPSRLARTSLVLAVAAVVTVPAFWAGWSNVFGAVSVGLALESRRRVGSLGAGTWTTLVLGSAAFVAGAVTCVLG